MSSANPPQPPALYDTTYSNPTGPITTVPAGGNLQTALNNVSPGGCIELAGGGIYPVNLNLPLKNGANKYIHIRGANPPPPGTRVKLSDAAAMPKIVAIGGLPAITASPGSHHYRMIGLEVYPDSDSTTGTISLGTGNETADSAFPHHIIVDRCYVHGISGHSNRRGVMFSGNFQAVIDSYVSDWKVLGQDSQAVAGWTGRGPFKIVNNYLEGAGENVMFGGADAKVSNLTPSDIEIRYNNFFKPLSWKIGDPSYAGNPWQVKNLLELKHAQRLLISNNVFENCWTQAQDGVGILFTILNQSGSNPWAVVNDVNFSLNSIRNCEGGTKVSGHDSEGQISPYSKRMLIKNNLYQNISQNLFYVFNGYEDLEIDHNTAFQTHSIIQAAGVPCSRFIFTNNITPHNEYGIIGDNFGVGNSAINHYFPSSVIRRNVIILPMPNPSEVDPSYYPPDNFFPLNIAAIQFENYPTDLRLKTTSPYYNAGTDGTSPGIQGGIMPKTLQVSNVEFGNVGGGTYVVKSQLVDSNSNVVLAEGDSAPVAVPADPAPIPTATTPTVTVS